MTVTKNLNPVNGPRKQCAIVSYVDSDLIADTAVNDLIATCFRSAISSQILQLAISSLHICFVSDLIALFHWRSLIADTAVSDLIAT